MSNPDLPTQAEVADAVAEPPTKHLQIRRMPLPASVARTLPRWRRGQ